MNYRQGQVFQIIPGCNSKRLLNLKTPGAVDNGILDRLPDL